MLNVTNVRLFVERLMPKEKALFLHTSAFSDSKMIEFLPVLFLLIL